MRSDTGVAVVWGGDLGVVGANCADAGGGSFGFPETGDKVEGKKAEEWLVAEGVDGKSDLWSRETTAPDLLG